jgi:hypothetical protein
VPDRRALLLAIGVGIGVAILTILVWRVPAAIGGGAAILLGGLALTSAISIRTDGATADAAWREAAPDLVDEPAGPAAGVQPAPRAAIAEAGAPEVAAVLRSRDVPSGD